MKANVALFFLFALLCIQTLKAQTDNKAPIGIGEPLTSKDIVFHKEFAGAGILHSHGFGVSFRFAQIKDIYKKKVSEFSLMDMKHPKEVRQQSLFALGNRSAKGYVYGKINNFYTLNYTIGRVRNLAEKARKSGVAVGYYYGIGPSLGLLKPYYLEVIVERDGRLVTEDIKYSPETEQQFLNNNLIYGSSGFTKGLNEMKFHAGLQAKLAINFDWASYDELVKGLEVGAVINAYSPELGGLFDGDIKGVQLVAKQPDNYFFTSFYLNIFFGKRW